MQTGAKTPRRCRRGDECAILERRLGILQDTKHSLPSAPWSREAPHEGRKEGGKGGAFSHKLSESLITRARLGESEPFGWREARDLLRDPRQR